MRTFMELQRLIAVFVIMMLADEEMLPDILIYCIEENYRGLHLVSDDSAPAPDAATPIYESVAAALLFDPDPR